MIGDVSLFFDADSEPDDFDCDTCQDSDCEICMRIAIEKSLSRSSIGNLEKGFDFTEN